MMANLDESMRNGVVYQAYDTWTSDNTSGVNTWGTFRRARASWEVVEPNPEPYTAEPLEPLEWPWNPQDDVLNPPEVPLPIRPVRRNPPMEPVEPEPETDRAKILRERMKDRGEL